MIDPIFSLGAVALEVVVVFHFVAGIINDSAQIVRGVVGVSEGHDAVGIGQLGEAAVGIIYERSYVPQCQQNYLANGMGPYKSIDTHARVKVPVGVV